MLNFLLLFGLMGAPSIATDQKYDDLYKEPTLDLSAPNSYKIEIEKKEGYIGKKLTFFIVSGDKKIIDQVLRLANNSIKNGVDIELVFAAHAVRYLSRMEYQNKKEEYSNKNIRNLIEEIIKHNGNVYAYEESRRDYGLKESDYIRGTGIMTGEKLISNVLLKDMKVITF